MSQNVEATNKILWNCYFNGKKWPFFCQENL